MEIKNSGDVIDRCTRHAGIEGIPLVAANRIWRHAQFLCRMFWWLYQQYFASLINVSFTSSRR